MTIGIFKSHVTRFDELKKKKNPKTTTTKKNKTKKRDHYFWIRDWIKWITCRVVRLTGTGVFERVESDEWVSMNTATVNACGTRRQELPLSPVIALLCGLCSFRDVKLSIEWLLFIYLLIDLGFFFLEGKNGTLSPARASQTSPSHITRCWLGEACASSVTRNQSRASLCHSQLSCIVSSPVYSPFYFAFMINNMKQRLKSVW